MKINTVRPLRRCGKILLKMAVDRLLIEVENM
jgi:hypothetical protein